MNLLFLKKSKLLSFCLLLAANAFVFNTHAQTVVEIRTNTTSGYNQGPITRATAAATVDVARYAYIYRQAELQTLGITPGAVITTLGFAKSNTTTSTGTGSIFSIALKTSTNQVFNQTAVPWSTITAGSTLVYENNNQVITNAVYPVFHQFTFNTPFVYSGGDLEVFTEYNASGVTGNPSSGAFNWFYDTVPESIYGATGATLANVESLKPLNTGNYAISNRRPQLQITFTEGPPCSTIPNGGQATKTTDNLCPGNEVALDVTNATASRGITYKWQSSEDSLSGYADISTFDNASAHIIRPSNTRYYRAVVACQDTLIAYSTPIRVLVQPMLAAGTYTLDNTQAASATNFPSFTALAEKLNCGIAGPIVVNVAPGVYNERFLLNDIYNTSATNFVRINGNAATLQFTNTTSERSIVAFSGTKYVTLDNLIIKTVDSTWGWGIHLSNNSKYDTFTNLVIDLSTMKSTLAANSAGIVASNSITSTTTAGTNASNLYIANNQIIGGSGLISGGVYYGLSLTGISTTAGGADSNFILNNEIINFYNQGIRISYGNGNVIAHNNVHRTGHLFTNSTYGIYLNYGDNNIVDANKVHSFSADSVIGSTNTQYGIYVTYPNNASNGSTIVKNNLVYNIGNSGGIVRGIHANLGNSVEILNNTVDINYSSPAGTGVQTAIYVDSDTSLYVIKNNLVSFTGGNNGGIKYGIYNDEADGIVPDGIQANNVYFKPLGTVGKFRIYNGAAYEDLNLFHDDYPNLEVTSSDVDPYFRNPAAGDYYPRNVRLYRSGEFLNGLVDLDLYSVVRNNPPGIGAIELKNLPNNDLSVFGLFAPLSLCAGAADVIITLENAGGNTITSGQINWTLNGVLQTPIQYTGNLASRTTENITVTNIVFDADSTYDFAFWSSMPNNVVDSNTFNDSLIVSKRVSLSGDYTINQGQPTAGSNFSSFTEAADYLNKYGVCGPVVFNVIDTLGNYVDTLYLKDISGTSAINTVTFKGNGATLAYNNTANSRQIVTFESTKYVTIDGLKIKTLASNYGWAVFMTKGAQYDSIINCTIDLTTITSITANYAMGIVASNSKTSVTTAGYAASNIYVGNNILNAGSPTAAGGAYYAISFYGISAAASGADSIIIKDNVIKNFYYYGINLYHGKDNIIEGNDISKPTQTASSNVTYAIQFYYQYGGKIVRNRIHDFAPNVQMTAAHQGIRVYYANNDAAATSVTTVANNAIYNVGNTTGAYHGIYVYSGRNVNFYHNTVSINKTATTGTTAQHGIYVTLVTNGTLQIKNNIVSFTGGNLSKKTGIYTALAALAPAGLQRNSVWMNSVNTGVQVRSWIGADYADLAALQAAHPTLEVGSIDEDPNYIDEANGNLKPGNINILMNGEDLFAIVPQDILGNNRPTDPTPGAFELLPQDYDNIGVAALAGPLGDYCSGLKNITVMLQNYGINDVRTADIDWTLNGVPQPTIPFNGIIEGTATSANNTTVINLGQHFIPFGTPTNIKVWTSLPNGKVDDYNQDDSLTTVLNAGSALTVNIGADTIICEGTSLELIANTGGGNFSYMWDNQTTGGTRTVNEAGTYYVIKTDRNDQCAGVDTIVVQTIKSPEVDLGPDMVVCNGTAVVLDAGAANVVHTIVWDNQSTSVLRTVTTPGTYSVTVTNANNCATTDAITITSKDTPSIAGINAIYALNATYNFNLKMPKNVLAAVWDFGDGSPVDTNFATTHTYAKNGYYTVTVTLISECDATVKVIHSETLDAIGLSINDNNALVAAMEVYPNPAKDQVSISVKAAKMQEVFVYNVVGQMMYNSKVNTDKVTLATQQLVSGTYIIKVVTDQGTVSKKIEIIR